MKFFRRLRRLIDALMVKYGDTGRFLSFMRALWAQSRDQICIDWDLVDALHR
jgi:hypothetical protein